MTAITRAPIAAWMSRPRPPKSETPPTTAAATPDSTRSRPAAASTDPTLRDREQPRERPRGSRADDERGPADRDDLDAGAARGLGVAADRVDVPAVRVRSSTKVPIQRMSSTIGTTIGTPSMTLPPTSSPFRMVGGWPRLRFSRNTTTPPSTAMTPSFAQTSAIVRFGTPARVRRRRVAERRHGARRPGRRRAAPSRPRSAGSVLDRPDLRDLRPGTAPPRPDDDQLEALEAEEQTQGHDERWNADPRDEEADERADQDADRRTRSRARRSSSRPAR